MTEQIFISYSKKDSGFTHKLADELQEAGFKIWIDRSIAGGDQWRETIENNLKAAGEVVIVVSLNSMASEWVKHEGSLAYGWGKQLFPILIEPVKSLPPWLEEYQWIDFVNKPYNIAFNALVAALTPPNPIQDLLDQQVQAYQQTGELIGEAILRVIDEHRETLSINAEAQEIIKKSQKAIQQREQSELEKAQQLARTQRQRAIVLALGLLVAVVLSVISFSLFRQSNQNLSNAQRANTQSAASAATATFALGEALNQEQISLSNQLAAQAQLIISERTSPLTRGVLLAVEALRRKPSPESHLALRNGLDLLPKTVAYLPHEDTVKSVTFSNNGDLLRTVDWNDNIKVWEIRSGKEIQDYASIEWSSFSAHANPWPSDFKPTFWGPNNELRAVQDSENPRILLFLDSDLHEISRIQLLQTEGFTMAAFSPDGQTIATTARGDDFARLWKTSSGEEIARFSHEGEGVEAVTFSPDGQYMGTISFSFTARIWKVTDGHEIARMQHSWSIESIAFSPDSRYVATGAGDHIAQVWEISNEEMLILEHPNDVRDIAYSPDGKTLAAASGSVLYLWNIENGQEVFQIKHEAQIESVAFSPDGKSLATTANDLMYLWDVVTGKEIKKFALDKESSIRGDVAFGPDDDLIAILGDSEIVMFLDPATGKEIKRFGAGNTVSGGRRNLFFSADGQRLAAIRPGSDGELVTVWDVYSGQEILEANVPSFSVLAFHPNGQLVATGQESEVSEFTIKLFDVSSGERISRIAHGNEVGALAFSHDGQWLASTSTDKILRIWDVSSLRNVSAIETEEYIGTLLFSPDDSQLAAIQGNEVAIHFTFPQDLIDEACGRLIRNLSLDEWKQYMPEEPYRATCPNLPGDPAVFLTQAEDSLKTEDHEQVASLYKQAAESAMEIEGLTPIDLLLLHYHICRSGIFNTYADEVLTSCEQLANPDSFGVSGYIYSGLSYALAGEYEKGITSLSTGLELLNEKIKRDIDWDGEAKEEDLELSSSLESWINDLEIQRNPFDPQTLKWLQKRLDIEY